MITNLVPPLVKPLVPSIITLGGAIESNIIFQLAAFQAGFTKSELVTVNACDEVSIWNDIGSGNNNDALQAVSTNQPLYVASGINTNPAIQFDSIDDFLNLVDLSSMTEGHLFFVFQLDNDPPTLAKSGVWHFGTDVNSTHFPHPNGTLIEGFGTTVRKITSDPTPSFASPTLYSVLSKSGEWTDRVNGTQLFTTATNTVGFRSLPFLGKSANAAQHLGGKIGEIILYDRVRTPAQVGNIEGNLATKWGITIP